MARPKSKSLRMELKYQVSEELSRGNEEFRKINQSPVDYLNNLTGPAFVLVKNCMELGFEAGEQKMAAIKSGLVPPNVSYEDTEQSQVYGEDAAMLNYELLTGLDYDVTSPHLSDWLKTIYLGDYEKFLSFLRDLSEEEVKVDKRGR